MVETLHAFHMPCCLSENLLCYLIYRKCFVTGVFTNRIYSFYFFNVKMKWEMKLHLFTCPDVLIHI